MFPIARMLPPTAGFKYPYTISQSCMFDSSSSTRMEFTPSAAGTEETWTFSAWIKRSTLGSVHQIINAAAGNEIQFTAANKLQFTTATGTLLTTQVFRDCSNWYNIIVAVDTTQATAADRVNIYVNGSAVSDFDTETYMNQNEVTEFFKAAAHTLGANEADTEEFDGYMAQVAFIDGTQYAASDFGETKNGIWVPKDITGLTYGSQGSLLAFATAANLGDDTSGNTNDWTESNFGTDHQVSDSPTNNYCMLDYNAMRSNMTALKEGGLSPQDAGAAWHSVLGTFPLKSGKWYFEVDVGGDADDIKAGIVAAGEYSGDIITADTDPGSIGYILHCDASGAVYNAESSGGATGDDNLDAPAVNDVMTIAIDCDNGKIWFGMKNAGSGHVWGDFGASGVGDPANGTNPAFSSLDFDLYDFVPVVGVNAHSTSMVNFGQRSFDGTRPSGFKAVCSSSMSEPDPIDAQDNYVNVVTYTGTGASNSITGVGFQPDFVWIKNRDQADAHQIFDSVRGVTKYLSSDATTVETADADTLTSFDSDGFTVDADVKVNTNNENYVAWCLQKKPRFFDIVTYTGTGVAHTESHNLGAAPELIIIKNRDAADNWLLYHHNALNKTDPETDYGILDTTVAWADAATAWNDTAPTSSVFTVGTGNAVNTDTENYIAYLFASLEGVSHVFSYEGNGNASGAYVYCGFRPKWIIIKNADDISNWMAMDDQRDTYNVVQEYLYPNGNDAAATTALLDVCANGFKLKNTGNAINNSNETYVGIAFADQPFKYANAR